jgi:hypothetical protein
MDDSYYTIKIPGRNFAVNILILFMFNISLKVLLFDSYLCLTIFVPDSVIIRI